MKKLSEETKVKLIYSGELMLFAIIFAVLGSLKFAHLFNSSELKRKIFNWITLFGGLWAFIDFFWALFSKKRRARISMIDKILLLPLAIFMETYDFISLVCKPSNINFYAYMLGSAFLYASIIYIFQSIYHFYKPIPGLLEDEKKEKEENSSKEENK